MRVNIKELKDSISKLNLAIEKTKLNPKAGWIELQSFDNNTITMRVVNYDYYIKSNIPFKCDNNEDQIHATVSSDTFIPLISKLDIEEAELYQTTQALVLKTMNAEYTFPIIKEFGKVKQLQEITFDREKCIHNYLSGSLISSIASINAKGLIDSVFSKDIQQYIYVDELGAITFTENIYINDFNYNVDEPFRILLNCTQAKLLKIFENYDNVSICIEKNTNYDTPNKVLFFTDNLSLILLTQPQRTVDKFPEQRLRQLAFVSNNTHIVLNKKDLDRALQRLMVFDKKFDITELNYSKLVFTENELKLVSTKNKNYEIIKYISSENAFCHESVIRFADLVNQLKAINTKEINISYGQTPALVINSNFKQLIPEIIQKV